MTACMNVCNEAERGRRALAVGAAPGPQLADVLLCEGAPLDAVLAGPQQRALPIEPQQHPPCRAITSFVHACVALCIALCLSPTNAAGPWARPSAIRCRT